MPTALLLLALAATDAPAHEVSLSAGAIGSYYSYAGGRTGAGSLIQTAGARTRWGKFGTEGTLSGIERPVRDANAYALIELRGGYVGERFELLGGFVSQLRFEGPAPVQLLPTLRAAWRFDAFTLSGGLFDLQGYAPVRVSVDVGSVGFGYVAPLGLEAHASRKVSDRLWLRAQLLVVRVYTAELALATVGGAFDVGF